MRKSLQGSGSCCIIKLMDQQKTQVGDFQPCVTVFAVVMSPLIFKRKTQRNVLFHEKMTVR